MNKVSNVLAMLSAIKATHGDVDIFILDDINAQLSNDIRASFVSEDKEDKGRVWLMSGKTQDAIKAFAKEDKKGLQ